MFDASVHVSSLPDPYRSYLVVELPDDILGRVCAVSLDRHLQHLFHIERYRSNLLSDKLILPLKDAIDLPGLGRDNGLPAQ
jgi:hypothetical protein